jgi:hypothetical protein
MSEIREWIARIEAGPLRERIRRLMAGLLMLSNAKAVNLQPSVKSGKAEGKAPPPVECLADHYAIEFEKHVTDPVKLEAICIKAEAELAAFKGGRDEVDRLKRERERDEQADIAQLVQHGQGIRAEILSARNHWPIGWVKHVRQRNDQDPETGYPRPRWRELSERERFHLVEGLREQEDLTQRATAMRLGISKGSVQRYWDRQEAA